MAALNNSDGCRLPQAKFIFFQSLLQTLQPSKFVCHRRDVFNGRALGDDVMDVILTLVTNTALGDGGPRYAGDTPGFSLFRRAAP